MARRVMVQLVDDLDGGEIEDDDGGTVTFTLDEVSYEIDLSAQRRAALQPNIERARSAAGERGVADQVRRLLMLSVEQPVGDDRGLAGLIQMHSCRVDGQGRVLVSLMLSVSST